MLLPELSYMCLSWLFYIPSDAASLPSLTMSDHRTVTSHLEDLNTDQLIVLGGELGLNYPRMRRMTSLMSDMVAAWLNGDDNVLTTSGPPSWASLIRALGSIGHQGIAQRINEGMRTPIGYFTWNMIHCQYLLLQPSLSTIQPPTQVQLLRRWLCWHYNVTLSYGHVLLFAIPSHFVTTLLFAMLYHTSTLYILYHFLLKNVFL